MTLFDTHRELVTVAISVGGTDITGNVVWAGTSFQVMAAAQPGSCTIVCRDDAGTLSFTGGEVIECQINSIRVWRGYLFQIEEGYFFADYAKRKWTLHGVDLNILFDKLILYNHTKPTEILTGGGAYPNGVIPQNEVDITYITNILKDSDIGVHSPTIDTSSGLTTVGNINSDGLGTPISPGATLRALFNDVAASVARTTPGSVIYYINADGTLIYQEQDTDEAPFSVGDDSSGVNVRELSITTDISSIKNDVLIVAGSLNPDPSSTQEYLLYKRNALTDSQHTYGFWQYAEVIPSYSQDAVNARSTKILYQEGTPAVRASFTLWRSGLYPGQLVTISASAHGYLGTLPIRAMDIDFPSYNIARYRITASFNTQDPYGLLLALKRPPTRGFVQPRFQTIKLDGYTAPPQVDIYTYVQEKPTYLGSNVYQTSYPYIRYSISVWVGGNHKFSVTEAGSNSTSAIFQETYPDQGKFKLFAAAGSQTVYCAYHTAGNFPA